MASQAFRPGRRRGFTLMELLVVIALIAILATLAAPTYRSFIVNQQLFAAASDFLTAVLQARSEALRLGRTVVLAPTDGADWHNGWRIFVDVDGSGTYSSAQTLIHTHPEAMGSAVTIDPSSVKTTGPFSGGTPSFAYQATGFPRGFFNGKLWLSAAETGRQRAIIVSNSGRVRLCDPTTDVSQCTAN